MQVKDIMTKELFTLRMEHTLNLVDDIMSWQRIRHIPVVNQKDELVGIISHRDLLKASVSSLSHISKGEQRKLYEKVVVGEIMNRNVVTTSPEMDLREAAAMMVENKIGCVPVLRGKKLVGIITEADFLTLAWNPEAKK